MDLWCDYTYEDFKKYYAAEVQSFFITHDLLLQYIDFRLFFKNFQYYITGKVLFKQAKKLFHFFLFTFLKNVFSYAILEQRCSIKRKEKNYAST